MLNRQQGDGTVTDNHQQEGTQWQVILSAASLLDQAGIPYTLEGTGALFAQGVQLAEKPIIRFSVQWDLLEKAKALFSGFEPDDICRHKKTWASFSFAIEGVPVTIIGYYRAVVRTDPDRLAVEANGYTLWVKAFDSYLRTLDKNDGVRQAIKRRLSDMQQANTQQNGAAWNQEAYQAWIERFGTPLEAAEKLRRDPQGRISQLTPYLGDVGGKKVINLLGSHGGKALALTLLGAAVTVVDISQENAAYAKETATALGIDLDYVVSDVLQLPADRRQPDYDLVLMELGILHYFVDLEPLAALARDLLKTGGRLVLQDFHPVSTKLITLTGKKQKVTGNYFDKSMETRRVAYSKHLSDAGGVENVYLRKWTLGEVVTAFAEAGLRVIRLDESPNMKISDIGIPKLFTLVCEK